MDSIIDQIYFTDKLKVLKELRITALIIEKNFLIAFMIKRVIRILKLFIENGLCPMKKN